MRSSSPGLFNICKTKNWHKVGPYCNRYADDVAYIDVNRTGNNALHEACRHQPPARVVQHLLTVQPRLSSHVNADGDLPLHIACRNQASLTVLRLLLESNVASSRQKDGKGHHTAIGILCCHASSETTMMKPNYKSIFWQKIRLLLLATSADRKGQCIISCNDTSHLLHAAVDVSAPTAVLKFCLDEFVGGSHQRDLLGQYPIHVAVNIPKESTVGVNPVFRIAKTSTIERLLQEYPESAYAQDTKNHPQGRFPIHTALLQGHDWFSGVRELTRCAPDILLVDDPEYGLKPFELANDLETTFQLLRRMPHALEASRRSVRGHQEVHPASEVFSVPEEDFFPIVQQQVELCSSKVTIAGPVQRFPGVVSNIGFAIAKAMIKPFQSSSSYSKSRMTFSENSRNEASGSSTRSVFEDQGQRCVDSDKTSFSKLGQLRRMSIERKMATIVEQPFEDEEEAESTEATMDVSESSSSCSVNHGRQVEISNTTDCNGGTKHPIMQRLEGGIESRAQGEDGPIVGGSCRGSSLRQFRNAFLDRLEIKQSEQLCTIESIALTTSESETCTRASILNESRLREEKPVFQVNSGACESLYYKDDESSTGASPQDDVSPALADPTTTSDILQLDSTQHGTGQQSKYNKYKSMLNSRPASRRDPRKAWRNDLPVDATLDFDGE